MSRDVLDELVLVELADGNYLPLPLGIATGDAGVTFLGLDVAGDAVVHVDGLHGPYVGPVPPEVVNARGWPVPFLDADDYRASLACAECSYNWDEVSECDDCGARTCACDHDCPAIPPAWPSDL